MLIIGPATNTLIGIGVGAGAGVVIMAIVLGAITVIIYIRKYSSSTLSSPKESAASASVIESAANLPLDSIPDMADPQYETIDRNSTKYNTQNNLSIHEETQEGTSQGSQVQIQEFEISDDDNPNYSSIKPLHTQCTNKIPMQKEQRKPCSSNCKDDSHTYSVVKKVGAKYYEDVDDMNAQRFAKTLECASNSTQENSKNWDDSHTYSVVKKVSKAKYKDDVHDTYAVVKKVSCESKICETNDPSSEKRPAQVPKMNYSITSEISEPAIIIKKKPLKIKDPVTVRINDVQIHNSGSPGSESEVTNEHDLDDDIDPPEIPPFDSSIMDELNKTEI